MSALKSYAACYVVYLWNQNYLFVRTDRSWYETLQPYFVNKLLWVPYHVSVQPSKMSALGQARTDLLFPKRPLIRKDLWPQIYNTSIHLIQAM